MGFKDLHLLQNVKVENKNQPHFGSRLRNSDILFMYVNGFSDGHNI